MVLLQTEWSDGSFLITSNALSRWKRPPVQEIEVQRFVTSTPVETLLAHHQGAMTSRRAWAPHVLPKPVRTLEEAIALDSREFAIARKRSLERGLVRKDVVALLRNADADQVWLHARHLLEAGSLSLYEPQSDGALSLPAFGGELSLREPNVVADPEV
jgi:hypothetical protein